MARMPRRVKIPAAAIADIGPTTSLAAERTARSSHAKKKAVTGYGTLAVPGHSRGRANGQSPARRPTVSQLREQDEPPARALRPFYSCSRYPACDGKINDRQAAEVAASSNEADESAPRD